MAINLLVVQIPSFAIVVAVVVVWAAAWVDLRTGRIPNALSVSAAGMGLAIQSESQGLAGLVQAIAGMTFGLGLMLPGYVLRSTGAGDVKLMAGVGALFGPVSVLAAFVLTILCGAAIALGIALVAWWRGGALGPFRRYAEMWRFFVATGRFSYLTPPPEEVMGKRFPFAVPIAIGTTLAAIGIHFGWIAG